jgi:LemA protein
MNGTFLVGLVLVFGIIVILVYVVGIYNTLVRLSNNIDKAWSNIDVILKQRHDELPKLVQVCNSYMTHERETLESVTNARSAYSRSTNVDEKAKAENQLTRALGKLFAIAEQYPDLKANQEFLNVQQRISSLENTIADRREFYNDSVNLYNIRIPCKTITGGRAVRSTRRRADLRQPRRVKRYSLNNGASQGKTSYVADRSRTSCCGNGIWMSADWNCSTRTWFNSP